MDNSTDLNRNSFLFYRSYYDAVAKIKNDKKRNELLLAIIDYGLDMKEPEFDDDMLDLAWVLIRPTLDANRKKYENAKKGGAPIGNKNAKGKRKNNQETTGNNQEQPIDNQKQRNVNVNANANANANENANANIEKEIDKEKEDANDDVPEWDHHSELLGEVPDEDEIAWDT